MKSFVYLTHHERTELLIELDTLSRAAKSIYPRVLESVTDRIIELYDEFENVHYFPYEQFLRNPHLPTACVIRLIKTAIEKNISIMDYSNIICHHLHCKELFRLFVEFPQGRKYDSVLGIEECPIEFVINVGMRDSIDARDRLAIITNPNTPSEVLVNLYKNSDDNWRRKDFIASHKNFPEYLKILHTLSQ